MPFNDSDRFRNDDDVRWQWREATWTTDGSPKGEHNQAHQYPSPRRGNANFAWVQHFIHHLAPYGMAGFVVGNGSMSFSQAHVPPTRFIRPSTRYQDCGCKRTRQNRRGLHDISGRLYPDKRVKLLP